MMKSLLKHMSLALLLFAASGCLSVITAQIYERQGTRAFLRKDYATAYERYSTAAADGNADAQYHLAAMYAEGKGVVKDRARAATLLTQASDQGQSDAQLMLGLFYVYGDGVERDPARGADLILKATEDRNDVAMFYMANLYAAGLGVPKDLDKALAMMTRADRNGFPVQPEMLTKEGLAALYQ